MSSLYKRNGWYYAQFFDAERKPRQKQIALKTRQRREAERLRLELEAEYERGGFDPWGRRPERSASDLSELGDAVAAFVRSRGNLSLHTVRRYRSVLDGLVGHVGASAPTRSVTVDDLYGYLDGTATRPVTKHSYRRAMRTFFRWLMSHDVVIEDVTEALRLDRVPLKYPRYLSPEDVEALCRAIERHDRRPKVTPGTSLWLLPIVRANVYLGLRAGELVNVRWEDLDLGRGTLNVVNRDGFTTKSGRERVLPVCAAVEGVVEGLARRSPWVFPNYGGTQLHRAYLSRRFKHFARLAGLPEAINFHATRHTTASWLAQEGASVEAIRRYMGHSSIAVTQRYMHLSPDGFAAQIERAFGDVR